MKKPLIFVGDEAGRRRVKEQPVTREQHGEDANASRRPPQHARQRSGGSRSRIASIAAVDRPEEMRYLRSADVAEEKRREHRRERQRVEQRDRDRAGDRQRELLVELARRAREERDRNEHGEQHERRRQHGAGDLAHRLARALERRHPLLLDEARDVLDHDDRVVDDETGRERQPEERERVDREPEHLHQEERADQRDRDRERRDQRRAPVLQEQEDDEHDERDRDQQRRHDFFDRLADESRRVERDFVAARRPETSRSRSSVSRDLLRDVRARCRSAAAGSRGRRASWPLNQMQPE